MCRLVKIIFTTERLVKIVLLARVSSNKYGVGNILEGSIWSTPSVCSVELKAKPKGHGPTLEETRPDHAIRSSVAITKLPLGRDIRKKKKKKNMKKEKCDFLKIFFLWIFLTFWLSYSLYSIITGSGTQEINFMEKFCVKAGISFSERAKRASSVMFVFN